MLKKLLFVVALVFLVASTHAKAATVDVGILICNYLTIDSSSALNFYSPDSHAIIRSTPFSQIETYIKNGYAGGAWNGLGGINSSVAAADPNCATALALVKGQDYFDCCGSSQFFGIPVQSGASLIRYTYYGDANLDGVVNNMDYNLVETAITSGGPSAGYSGWSWGDFNYDGLINGDDLFWFEINGELDLPALPSATTLSAIIWEGGSTNWNSEANWDPNYAPNAPGIQIRFGNAGSGKVVDLVSQEQTVGSITFAAAISTTIKSSGNFPLILDNNGLTSTIEVAGSHTISARVELHNDAIISGPGTLNLSGGIVGDYTLTVLGNLSAKSIEVDTLHIGNVGTTQTQTVPEPSTIALLLTAALGSLLVWRRRR